jgi:hypothetical protein
MKKIQSLTEFKNGMANPSELEHYKNVEHFAEIKNIGGITYILDEILMTDQISSNPYDESTEPNTILRVYKVALWDAEIDELVFYEMAVIHGLDGQWQEIRYTKKI